MQKKSIKKILKRILLILTIILSGVVRFVLLYFAAAFCLSRIAVPAEKNAPDELAIYIKTNGVHVDIVLPVKSKQIDWSKEVKFENNMSKDTNYQYLAIGWGDKGFYLETPTWSELKLSVAFKAVFWLGTTAMHTTYYKEMTEGEDCRKIMISEEQYSRLVKYILSRFQTDPEGHFINIKTNANYGDSDAFYEAKGRYNLFFTCNTWANKALKASGQKACVWTVFNTGIFLKYPL